ncbi:glycerate kinase type-2 family protein [Pseudothermotoga thermarum]|uniref:Glycerate 2-kinase n=1 Tax=Pseudothermotoga thermarum DSM 5069 TaxID=688269 RepID=F7YUH4_9THEM|nr:glycerate kinase [Pseudothermotoga thermarum]AEH51445.1 glycerate 2-kinase [Pseudothermotoga thermarum DSM 5069]
MSKHNLVKDALQIIQKTIESVLPDNAVKDQLSKLNLDGKFFVLAIGKAAWRMAKAASEILKDKIIKGVVITKYNHSLGEIENFEIYEAGHPVPDENSLKATDRALQLISKLDETVQILFLISGGGSSLFEKLKEGITLAQLQQITKDLLACGANITEINAIRKRLSLVKGGKFAEFVYPRKIIALVLSDVLQDRLDSIASGPAYPDLTTTQEVLQIVERYNLRLDEPLKRYLLEETPKVVTNAEHYIIGSVKTACETAESVAKSLGYNTVILTTTLNCEAKEAGRFLASIAKEILIFDRPIRKPAAIILGGETVVHVKGTGKGGRNQELALSAAIEIAGLKSVVIASVGTDGTDGPTDAAGGIVDGQTVLKIKEAGLDPIKLLDNNDSYRALDLANCLLKIGPTGTNVNDLVLALIA